MSITPPDPETAKGFSAVDAQPDPSFLEAGMEATAEWPAVIQLRDFERATLSPTPGDRVLDGSPTSRPPPPASSPLASVTSDLVGMGLLNQDLADRFVEGITTAGRDGRFWMSVTMTTVVARRPG